MWLLDASLDIHLPGLLRRLHIGCDSAENRGWKALRNGDLVAAAAEVAFHTLLTRDRLFAESASRAWRAYPNLSIVVVTLPQLPSARYIEGGFNTPHAAWAASPIRPQPGEIVFWP